jgi:hypothetical protein
MTMRVVREYFGVDRTTVTYEHQVSGVGGNADEFFILCRAGGQHGKPAVRMTVHFTHDEMAQLLSDYREHHSIEGQAQLSLLHGPQARWYQRITRVIFSCRRR